MTDGISQELDRKVLVITLDDPATLNALTPDRAHAIAAAVTDAPGQGARAVLLTGAGRAFCSGTSLAGELDLTVAELDVGQTLERHYNPMMEALRASPLPLVTAVRGAAAGIGCSIALMGDIIIAAESAYFLQAFRNIGLVPDGGAAFLLSRAVGRVRAMEMMLLGERLPAARALEWGLVTRVVPDETLDEAAMDLARQLADGPAALGAIRRGAWAALETGFTGQLALEREDQRVAGRTADFREGVAAFLGKRPPRFTGE